MPAPPRFTLTDRSGSRADALRADALAGLLTAPRTLRSRWLYDDRRGRELAEEISRLPEFYPARTELGLLTGRAEEIAQVTGAASLVELGSGPSSRGTRLLLTALTASGTLRRYCPQDISAAAVEDTGRAIARDYPDLLVSASVSDFDDPPGPDDEPAPRLVALLGGGLGRLDAPARRAFLRQVRAHLGPGDHLLLGADLVKTPEVLLPAYWDSAGVTAEFNRNVLHVLNAGTGADFDPDAFDHLALWDPVRERIELRLRSRIRQTVHIPALLTVELEAREDLRTQLACTFRRGPLTAELASAGFAVRHWWTDPAGACALLLAAPG